MTEQNRALSFSRKHSCFVGLRLGRKALDVGKRRAVTHEHPVEFRANRELVEPFDQLGPERLARRRHGRRDELMRSRRHLRLLAQPALHVAPDPNRGGQGVEELGRLTWPRPEGRVVAAEDVLRDSLALHLREDSLERREVAVDVVEERGRLAGHNGRTVVKRDARKQVVRGHRATKIGTEEAR